MKLYRLDIDDVLSNLSLFTEYDIGGEGHGIVVDENHLHDAIAEITANFSEVIGSSFEVVAPCEATGECPYGEGHSCSNCEEG